MKIEVTEREIISLLRFAITTDNKELLEKVQAEMVNYIKKNDITIENIVIIVCDFFNIKKAQLLSYDRHKHIAVPRQIAHYAAKILTKEIYSKIGEQIGKRDHATVLHSVRVVEDLMFSDKKFKYQVDYVLHLINPLYEKPVKPVVEMRKIPIMPIKKQAEPKNIVRFKHEYKDKFADMPTFSKLK